MGRHDGMYTDAGKRSGGDGRRAMDGPMYRYLMSRYSLDFCTDLPRIAKPNCRTDEMQTSRDVHALFCCSLRLLFHPGSREDSGSYCMQLVTRATSSEPGHAIVLAGYAECRGIALINGLHSVMILIYVDYPLPPLDHTSRSPPPRLYTTPPHRPGNMAKKDMDRDIS